MAYLAVNRDGEELVFNDCPIYDRASCIAGGQSHSCDNLFFTDFRVRTQWMPQQAMIART